MTTNLAEKTDVLRSFLADPSACKVQLATTMQMVWSEDRSTWDMEPRSLFQIWTPTEAGRFRKKPDFALVADSYARALRDLADFFDQGVNDPPVDNEPYG